MTFDELTSGPCALPDAPIAMPTQMLERAPTERPKTTQRWQFLRWLNLSQRLAGRNPA